MGKLQNKVAVVTGASKGIGAAIAKAFAAEGASVVVNYASSREGADKVVSEITANGGKAVAVGGDVSKAADVKALFDAAKQAFGKIDVLVNNAGVYAFAPLEDVTEDSFHRHFNINVLGPILTTREALKHFPAEGGSVINVSSVAAFNPVATASVYSATKGALDTLTQVLSVELGRRNIRVNSLSPGLIETEGTHVLGTIGGDFEKQIVDRTPLNRVGKPDDIAQAAVFLASDAARWVTGERLAAAGGYR
ncbi:glucose 1-dehydrogenase [Hyphomicrobium sp. NDB2Meth4]|uniref:SDR family NAD(P)-dependent oxidoreductase n=1 Tax=Hyphomicrobium sp. NDB2Meth4 TaxID=1892846 RepID=UPI000931FC26|nr:glucose 1-dehydrogenase [Hyphomicrobium sp. NDB2Meth4]